MNINSHILKLSGKSELPEAIELGSNYHVSLEGAITSTTDTDNEDGTINRVYAFKPIKIDLLTPKGKSLKLKDTRSKSQLLRARFWKQWQVSGSPLSFEDWYDRLMTNLIQRAEEVAEMYQEL